MNFSKYNFLAFTASGANLTSTAHELYTDDTVVLETTGTLPAGLAVKTTYYVVYNGITADTFQISANRGGEPITTTDGGTGDHTYLKTNRARLTPFYEDNR